jgi:Pentapeptide repeats (9 copies)/Pentapeptide repeats (8 copies)
MNRSLLLPVFKIVFARKTQRIFEKTAENPEVEKLRLFFDEKTNYLRADKLSQAYISAKFTRDESSEYGVSLYHLRLMFEAYCQDPTFTPSLGLPVEWWSIEKWGELGKWFKNKPKKIIRRRAIKILAVGTVAVAIVSAAGKMTHSVLNLSGVEREKYFQAWQVINTAKDQTGMGGRNEALQYLNKESSSWYTPECKRSNVNNCLVGIKIEKANLNKVNLEGANLNTSEFVGTSFRDAILKNVAFTDANLEGAVFKKANLEGAIFEGANLRITKSLRNDPELKGAIFEGANLTNTNFKGARNLDVAIAFNGATYCKTIMPDGTMKEPKCEK